MAVVNGVAIHQEKVESTKSKDAHKQTFTLEILQIVRDAQQQHGLRHGDYQRYRSYCSRRIRRLRKALHFLQGTKHRFQPKKITEEMLADVRYLYLPLMMTERAWGYAMQLKQEANTEQRKKFHLVGRLRKAAKYAEELEKLCESSCCDARTKLEAQAYLSWINGSLDFELEKWQEAMEYFRKAQTIYEKLSDALNEDERLLYEQRVSELTPNIRYCAYNIGDESAMDDLKQMRHTVQGEGILSSKLDVLIAQTREKQTATLSTITWLGRTVPVKLEKVRLFLFMVQECEEEVGNATDLDEKIAVYERLLLECKDVLQMLRDELKNDQTFRPRGQTGDAPVSNLAYLYSYVMYIRLTKTVDRSLLMVQVLKKSMVTTGRNVETNRKLTKPQDLIRPYDNILQNLNEMTQLAGVDSSSKFVEDIDAQVKAYKAHRSCYLAEAYGSAGKWTEAMALYQRAGQHCRDANSSGQLAKPLQAPLQELEMSIEGQIHSAHANSILGSDSQADSPQPQLSPLEKKMLVDRLDQYYQDPSLTSKQPKVAQFPPEFRPVPCKPLFFDLALNRLDFPSLEDKVEQKKGGGLTGFVKGWLGGWKK